MSTLPPRLRNTLISLAAIVVLAWVASLDGELQPVPADFRAKERQPSPLTSVAPEFTDALSGQMVRVEAEVNRELKDDNKGSRHQRFLIHTTSGTSILVAHNIDLAPRVVDLVPGERISLYGEYEWNPKGGVLHWTHHAPRGDHEDGWIEYRGKRYQ